MRALAIEDLAEAAGLLLAAAAEPVDGDGGQLLGARFELRQERLDVARSRREQAAPNRLRRRALAGKRPVEQIERPRLGLACVVPEDLERLPGGVVVGAGEAHPRRTAGVGRVDDLLDEPPPRPDVDQLAHARRRRPTRRGVDFVAGRRPRGATIGGSLDLGRAGRGRPA